MFSERSSVWQWTPPVIPYSTGPRRPALQGGMQHVQKSHLVYQILIKLLLSLGISVIAAVSTIFATSLIVEALVRSKSQQSSEKHMTASWRRRRRWDMVWGVDSRAHFFHQVRQPSLWARPVHFHPANRWMNAYLLAPTAPVGAESATRISSGA